VFGGFLLFPTFAGMTRTKNLISVISYAFLAGIILSGCAGPNGWKKIDVSKEKVNYTVQRFEQDFFAIDTNHIGESEQKLRAKYGEFYDYYVHAIMNFGRPENRFDTASHDPHIDMAQFLGSRFDRDLYDTVQKEYPEMADIQSGLTDMFRHFQYYFPGKPRISKVYTFISQFGYGAATYDDSIICIGLDMYLGDTYRYYQSGDFPEYMIAKLKRPYIIPNVADVLYKLHFDRTAYNAQLPFIEGMINEGKKYYFMECMLPDAPDSLIMGYTKPQEEWCRKSEASIWKYFNERDLLYKVNYMEQKRYITDGPTTAGMPAEAPAKVGAWVGWQIVRKFMKNNSGRVTLRDLLEKYSAKQIFTMSNYKPK
jgi:hypothetical protein